MKVAIVAPTPVPFTRGGAERAWAGLHAALLDAGHDADIVKLPVREQSFAELVAGYRAFASLDLTHFDTVISSKYPAWMCRHPNHVLWMFHPLRGLYDTYHVFGRSTVPGHVEPPTAALLAAVRGSARRDRVDEVLDLVDTAVDALGADHPDLVLPGPASRLVIQWLDRTALDPSEIARHTTLSRTIASRPDYLPEGVMARVAYAPSDVAAPSFDGPDAPARGHLFTASRLDGPKRIELLIAAMAHVPDDVPLLIGGTGPLDDSLRRAAAHDPRIRFVGFVSDDDLAGYYAAALAVPFIPADEDYGLITVEALAAGAPVVTCTDSGGPAEVVHDGVEGFVVDPQPAAIGRALAQLTGDPGLVASMGQAGRRRAARITWPAVVRALVGSAGRGGSEAPEEDEPGGESDPSSESTHRRAGRRRVVVLTTFRVADRGHGGQLRSYHLYGSLGRHADVEIVSLTDGGRAGSVRLLPGLVETAVPITDAHRRVAEERSAAVGVPVSDVVAGSDIALTPEYLRALVRASRGADALILAEPYMLPAIDEAGIDVPFVYDAFNVEADLKADVLPPTRAGTQEYEAVRAVEHDAVVRAAAITACSIDDAARLVAMAGRPLDDATVVPNGTDCAAIVPPSPDQRRRRGDRWLARYFAGTRPPSSSPNGGAPTTLAVFFGSWHPPNLVAAEVVIDLAGDVPDVVFLMGGRHGDAFAHRVVPPNVVFTGVVSPRAKATLLGSAHVALNPMVQGSGTNLKVIEYLAAGAPVLSTGFGVRGLDAIDGEHLLVAEPADWAEALASIAGDPDAAARRAIAGRRLAEERYDWSTLADRLDTVVSGVAEPSVPGPAPAVR